MIRNGARNGWYVAKTTLLFLAAAALFAACGGQPPEKSFEAFARDVDQGDFESCWDRLSSNAQAHWDREARTWREAWPKVKAQAEADERKKPIVEFMLKRFNLTEEDIPTLDGKKLFVGKLATDAEVQGENREVLGLAWKGAENMHVHRVEIDGDEAKLYLKGKSGDDLNRPILMLKEGGKWKIDFGEKRKS